MSSRIPIQGTVVGLGAAALVAAGGIGAHVTGTLGDPTPSEVQVAKQNRAPVAAERQAAAETAAREAKAVAAVKAARVASSRAGRSSSRTLRGGPRGIARSMASSRYSWGSGQVGCLNSLWQRESGWNHRASNSSSGAYGIPQALPGSKMASKGSDWRTNPATQIAWGLSYIDRTYGRPCAAWSKLRAQGWY